LNIILKGLSYEKPSFTFTLVFDSQIPNSRFQIWIAKGNFPSISTSDRSDHHPLHAATPGFDTLVNYDTAWTNVYDGGENKYGVVDRRFS